MKARRQIATVLALAGCGVSSAAQDSPTRSTTIRPADVQIAFDKKRIITSQVSGDAGVVGRAVSANDPVRVASISKLVTALAAMRLVDAGKLDLDRDINSYLGYSVRNPAFPEMPITMRLLIRTDPRLPTTSITSCRSTARLRPCSPILKHGRRRMLRERGFLMPT